MAANKEPQEIELFLVTGSTHMYKGEPCAVCKKDFCENEKMYVLDHWKDEKPDPPRYFHQECYDNLRNDDGDWRAWRRRVGIIPKNTAEPQKDVIKDTGNYDMPRMTGKVYMSTGFTCTLCF